MTSSMMRGRRRGLWLLAAGAAAVGFGVSTPAGAQLPPGAVVQPLDTDNGAELRRHLNTLAENPRSLSALIGAGRAALEAGDPEAALSFFGRADEISPRDARAKAGMASALVRLEQPEPALRLFGEAVALGAPEAEIAGDRGLAHDTLGDPRRAQQDYTISLRHRDDPEIRRRLALSLAISGQREPALRLIDDQLRRNDRAGRRTQAFVLALTGDTAGATRVAQAVMPAAAQAMAPFLARLSGLSPGQKARAVHFGHFPTDGRALPSSADTRPDPGALALAGGAPAPAAASPQRPAPQAEPATRRRPGSNEDWAERVGPASRAPLPSRRRDRQAEQRSEPVQVAQLETRRSAPAAAQPAQPARPQPTEQPSPTRFQPADPAPAAPATSSQSGSAASTILADRSNASPAVATTAIPPSRQQAQPIVPTSTETGAAIEPGRSDAAGAASPQDNPLAEIASVVNALREEPAAPAPEPSPRRREPVAQAQRSERSASNRAQSRSRPAQPAHPSRHWVQIAGGADRNALPREFARLRALAPQQLGNRTAYTTPLRATNRLLVGPFSTAEEAQEFVNALARHDVAAFAWTSPAGQEIERLQAAR